MRLYYWLWVSTSELTLFPRTFTGIHCSVELISQTIRCPVDLEVTQASFIIQISACTHTIPNYSPIPPLSRMCTMTTHVHDALRRTMSLHIAHADKPCGAEMSGICQSSERLRLNRAWNMSVIYTSLVRTLHNVLSYALSLVLFLLS